MRGRWVAVALTMGLLIGQVPVAAQDASGPPAAMPSLPAAGSLWVTIGQSGAMDMDVVAVLWSSLDADQADHIAWGSFNVEVTSDPFLTTQPIRQGSPWLRTRAINEQPVALIPPGGYTLMVWLGRDLQPYGPWMPAVPIEAMCVLPVTVSTGMAATTVALAIPPGDGSGYVPTDRDLTCLPLDAPSSPPPSPAAG